MHSPFRSCPACSHFGLQGDRKGIAEPLDSARIAFDWDWLEETGGDWRPLCISARYEQIAMETPRLFKPEPVASSQLHDPDD
jgi:hypothetical protein